MVDCSWLVVVAEKVLGARKRPYCATGNYLLQQTPTFSLRYFHSDNNPDGGLQPAM